MDANTSGANVAQSFAFCDEGDLAIDGFSQFFALEGGSIGDIARLSFGNSYGNNLLSHITTVVVGPDNPIRVSSTVQCFDNPPLR